MGLHRLRGYLGIVAALAITAGALIAAAVSDPPAHGGSGSFSDRM